MIASGYAQGLLEFLAFAAQRGLMKPSTVAGLRTAAENVLEAVEGPEWKTVDLRAIDVDDFGDRFATRKAGTIKPQSLSAYRSRFRKAVTDYLAYLEDPAGWRPRSDRSAQAARPSKRRADASTRATFEPALESVGTIIHRYPLRPELIVDITLPRDLSLREARRLGAFIETLATDYGVSASPSA